MPPLESPEGSGLREPLGVGEEVGGRRVLVHPDQFAKRPLAVVALVPRDAALFFAGTIAGPAAKTVTPPLDSIKLLMQTHGVRFGNEGAKKAICFVEAITMIGKEEGIKGYWKGNLPQVIRIIPYSTIQLFAYEFYKVQMEPVALRVDPKQVDLIHRDLKMWA